MGDRPKVFPAGFTAALHAAAEAMPMPIPRARWAAGGSPCPVVFFPPLASHVDMPQRLLTKTGRYSRRVLYGCTAALSIAIVGAVLLLGRGIVDQYGDRQVARFVRTSGEVRTEVDGLSARLAQFADLYEGVWNLRQNDVVPTRRYAGKLAADRGATVTGADLTATPVTLISSLDRPADGARLAMALRVLRDVSGAPLMDAQ
ncbi:hypothetical protein ACQCRM_26205, partial [Ralstonia pseudosolanacearum]